MNSKSNFDCQTHQRLADEIVVFLRGGSNLSIDSNQRYCLEHSEEPYNKQEIWFHNNLASISKQCISDVILILECLKSVRFKG